MRSSARCCRFQHTRIDVVPPHRCQGYLNASVNDREGRHAQQELFRRGGVTADDPVIRVGTTLIWERLAIAVGDDFPRRMSPALRCDDDLSSAWPGAAVRLRHRALF